MSDMTIFNGYGREQQQNVSRGMQIVDYFIRRNYLSKLASYDVIPAPKNLAYSLRLNRVQKIVLDDKEDINEKLISVYSALQNVDATVFVLLKGTVSGVEFYLGARTNNETSGIPANVLENTFKANFPGSELSSEWDNSIQSILGGQRFDNISSVTVVPSSRKENDKNFVQGIEKLIDTMRGKEYSALFISNPVSKDELDNRRTGLEQLYSAISPYAKTTLAYGENDSHSISNGSFKNFSSTVNRNISKTIGSSFSNSSNESWQTGIFRDGSKGTSTSSTYSESDTMSHGSAETEGHGTNYSTADTTGSSKTMTIEATNKTAADILQYIEEQLERIKNCESFGVWETAAYFCSGQIENSLVASSTFKALVSGDNTNAENAYINNWIANTNATERAKTEQIAEYLKMCEHPRFVVEGGAFVDKQLVTPCNHISGQELPIFMGVPQKSVAGVTVTTIAEFGRNVVAADAQRVLPLGHIHHMGTKETNNKVALDLNSLTSHCFICGSTGSGKSNTTSVVLDGLIRYNIPFLVIEPAKGEYKHDFGGVEGINIFTSNPYMGAMLKINPFEFHPNIHVLEHLDRLIEIFNACWEMYAAMPAILKNAIEKAYIRKGWDLQNSIYLGAGEPQFPTFADVLNILPTIIKSSGYSSDTQGDYTGALVTRVESLTNGIAGQIFCDNYYVPDSVLFDENTIVDLSRIGSAETKSLIMGVLVMRLNEYRMANATGSNRALSHVTVLEEAHNLLKNVSQAQGQQTANPVGKSVEMICNSIAEMRTYGEGFIIVDQSPSSVDIAAIKNTNTKIVMRLPEMHDCEAVANSLSLNEAQTRELSKLPVGVAAVFQNNWTETVLCQVEKAPADYHNTPTTNTFAQLRALRSTVLEFVVAEFAAKKAVDYDALCVVIDSADASIAAKAEMRQRCRYLCGSVQMDDNNNTFFMALLYLSGMNAVFETEAEMIQGKETDPKVAKTWRSAVTDHMQRLFTFKDDQTLIKLRKYCLYAMRWLSSNVDYAAIYRALQGKE